MERRPPGGGHVILTRPEDFERIGKVEVFTPRKAPEIANGSGQSDDAATIGCLAGLSALQYDRAREEEAKRLGIRVSTLDEEVRKARGEAEEEDQEADVLADPVPWSHPVDGPVLLAEIADTISRHMVLPSGAADVVALWIVHAHAHDAARISPILAVTSPTPECGKTTLLTLLGAMTPRPLHASNITAAALFRAVEKWRPTMIIDEADTFLRDSDELRGVLNSGHNRAAAFVIRTTGDDHDPKAFKTWAPKAIALIGKLPATLSSRSIHLELRRMGIGERVEELRADRLAHLEPIRRKAWRWAQDNMDRLRSTEPILPTGIRGRAADNWRPLLAIADVAGGDWPALARHVAGEMEDKRRDETAGIVLLGDIRDLFFDRETDRLRSATIVEALGAMEDRPWPEWRKGKPITETQLAKLLEPFKIHPRKVRFHDKTLQGYESKTFSDAFWRYLPPSEPEHRNR